MNVSRWAVGVALVTLTACGGIPDSVLEQGRERRLEAAGVGPIDADGTHALAGMSAVRKIEVDALDKRRLGGDTLGESFLAFHARCSACHEAPDPRGKTAAEWGSVLARMSHNQEEAGLMPMLPGDKASVMEFLERHAKPAR